jgi:hypothetical protein
MNADQSGVVLVNGWLLRGWDCGVSATAQALRLGKRTFTLKHSHVASMKGDLVRARSVFKHRALPVNSALSH